MYAIMHFSPLVLMLWLMALMPFHKAMPADEYASKRQAMVKEVETMVRETMQYTGKSRLSEAVVQAMAKVPRHEFVPADMAHLAYLNRALPITHDQTISQPYIVALMTDLADLEADEKVLEVGTGSGYQAAILAELGVQVYSIEIIRPLGEAAREQLHRLGYENVQLRIGDGYQGWPDAAPFDAVVVTAASESIPQPLIDQLAVGGRMVIPVGPHGQMQKLNVVQKKADGEIVSRALIPVGFVPLTRDEDARTD